MVAGGTAGCQALFDAFRVREARELAPSHASTRLTVDVYCLQHPDRYCVSAKSLAAHLTGLGWALEFGGGESGLKALQQFLNGQVALAKPPLPESRGDLTIASLATATTTESYIRGQEAWARATWAAYEPLHETARAWMRAATRARGYRPSR